MTQILFPQWASVRSFSVEPEEMMRREDALHSLVADPLTDGIRLTWTALQIGSPLLNVRTNTGGNAILANWDFPLCCPRQALLD